MVIVSWFTLSATICYGVRNASIRHSLCLSRIQFTHFAASHILIVTLVNGRSEQMADMLHGEDEGDTNSYLL